MRRFVLVVAFAVAACHAHGGGGDGGGADMAFVPAFAAHDKVDLLVMIDNSPGTSPKQAELANRFPQLIKALDDAAARGHPASYHIGVVDPDLGAGPYTLNQGQCHPGGDRGVLQVLPSSSTSGPPPSSCATFALANGARYIDYDQIAGTSNIMGGVSVPQAFTCMAAVGDAGCGFEHVLESVYVALHDPPVENAGFLRADALLVVLFLTDEDDCSAPPDGDLFDPSPDGVAKYGTLHSFRCTQWGISCGLPPHPLDLSGASGPFDNCQPLDQANGGKLFDVSRYIDFFTRPGGVKADPSDVVLATISAPSAPFQWTTTSPCADQVNTVSCPILDHSCIATTNAKFFADPAVRLNAVIAAAATSQQSSVCDTDYSGAVDDIAQKIVARLQ